MFHLAFLFNSLIRAYLAQANVLEVNTPTFGEITPKTDYWPVRTRRT